MSHKGKITKINEGSLAEEIGLVPGDAVMAINGQNLTDIIDLSFAFAEEEIELLIEHADGSQEIIEFDKDYDEELGVEFETAVFDGIRRCGNKCCFCFVDQIAPGMRESLSVKDDDYRMSFLYGNFVTMTNMSRNDFTRIEKLHLSPLYLSIHTTNPELRCRLMNSKRAAEVNTQLDIIDAMDIQYHTQIVLCPGLNDGAELTKTIDDLAKRAGTLSIAIVPVGLTRFRDNCFPLKMFDKEKALAVIKQVEQYQERFRQEKATTFVYLSDEFYLTAQQPLPISEHYDGFPQLDNGIGLSRNFIEDWQQIVSENSNMKNGYSEKLHLTVICGKSAAPIFTDLFSKVKIDNLSITVLAVNNDFFGSEITVTGLLTGQDILKNLQNQTGNCDGVIIPAAALRDGEDIFLDDYSLEDLQKNYTKKIKVAADARSLYNLFTKWHEVEDRRKRALYTWQSNAGYTK